MSSHCKFLSFIVFNLIVAQSTIAQQQELKRQIFDDALAVWQSFRDPDNGVWCDTLRFNQKPMVQCGPNNNFYSSAGTGENFVYYLNNSRFLGPGIFRQLGICMLPV